MITDAEITDMLRNAGVVEAVLPFSDGAMQILKRFATEIDKRARNDVLKNEFICSKCGLRKNDEHECAHQF